MLTDSCGHLNAPGRRRASHLKRDVSRRPRSKVFGSSAGGVLSCAYSVFLAGRLSSHQEIILTTMPNCSDSTSSSYSPFSSASALSSFCSGRFFIRFCKRGEHKQTHSRGAGRQASTHAHTHKGREGEKERERRLMQISFSVCVWIKLNS